MLVGYLQKILYALVRVSAGAPDINAGTGARTNVLE